MNWDMRYVRDWTALPTELLGCIANRLPLIEDFNAFRGVCTCWRAVDVKCAPASKVPLLMLAENDGSDEREFYSLAKGRICMRKSLPETVGKKCLNAGFGWILTIALSGDVCLLKPFSPAATVFELPNVRTFPETVGIMKGSNVYHVIRGAFLTADPSQTLDFKVVLTLHGDIGSWRIGENWTIIQPNAPNMVYCKELGKMYTLDFDFDFYTEDVYISTWGSDLTKPLEQVKVDNVPTYTQIRGIGRYLVISTDGELLMITRNNTHRRGNDEGDDHFRVMKVDLVIGECRDIDGLGNDAVFLGDRAAVCVDAAKFPGVLRPNSIYFTDDSHFSFRCNAKGDGKDMGIYNVANRNIQRFNVESFSPISPPLWLFP